MRILPVVGKIGFRFKQPYPNVPPFIADGLVGKPHEGLDIICPGGTEIKSPADGQIIGVPITAQQGKAVHIKTLEGLFIRLMHNSVVIVHVGQIVHAGDVVALSGNTGASSAPHCHIDVSHKLNSSHIEDYIDPEIFIKEGDDMAVSPGTANSALVAIGAKNIALQDTIRLAELWTIGGADKQKEIDSIFKKYGGSMVVVPDILNVNGISYKKQ